MPVRFTSPSLGGQRQVFLHEGERELGISYRRLTADDWFVEDQIVPSQAPGGQPNRFNVNTVDVSLAYGVSERVSLLLTIPFSTGTNSRIHPDGSRRETSATGIGDINLVGNIWLLNPKTHSGRNVAVGLGLKAPTGNNEAKDVFGLPSGPVQFAVHPGLQPGGGGWGVLLQVQAFQHITGGLSGYLSGLYELTPQELTEVTFAPTSTVGRSVHDVYHGRFGLGYALWPDQGISASLGARFDGIPVHDIIGGDDGFRTPGFVAYLDPGLAISPGKHTFTLSIPLRLHGEFKKNVHDLSGGPPPSGDRGDLASYLIFLGYARRF